MAPSAGWPALVARHRREQRAELLDEVKELNRQGQALRRRHGAAAIVAPPDDCPRAPEHAAVALHDVACVDLDDSLTNLLSRLAARSRRC